MYVYRGKLNYYDNAVDEEFSIVFPKGLNLGDPACAFWQWTVDSQGKKKGNVEYIGSIDSITVSNKFWLFSEKYYRFECLPSADEKTLTVTNIDSYHYDGAHSHPITLDLIYPNAATGDIPHQIGCDIFTGKLNWFEYAQDEMINLVFLVGDVFETPAIGVWQWTVDAHGVKKKSNVVVQKALDSIVKEGGVRILSFFQDEYYKFAGELSADGLAMTVTMTNPKGETFAPTTLKRTYQFKAPSYRSVMDASCQIRCKVQ